MITKIVAGIILIIIAYTWSQLSIQNGYFMPLTMNIYEISGILASCIGGLAAAEKWGGKKE